MSKKILKILIAIFIILIIVMSIFLVKNNLEDNKSIDKNNESFKGFTFKDVEKLNIGKYTINDFVEEDIICDEKCTYDSKEVTYTISDVQKLGRQNISVSITYEGNEYKKDFDVEIVDEMSPEIILSNEEVIIDEGGNFDPKSYITDIKDNYNSNLIDKVEIQSTVDNTKSGNYVVTYTVTDENGNKSTKILNVIVNNSNNQSNSNITSNTQSNNNTNSNKSNNNTSNTNTSNTNKSNSTKPKTTTTSNKSTTTTKSTGFRKDINSVKLNPLKTRYDKLDKQIEQIINKYTNSKMDNYEKLNKVYHYVIDTLSYGGGVIDLSSSDYKDISKAHHYYSSDVSYIYESLKALQTKKGVCNDYAALFMILSRRLGFESYAVGGKIKLSKGGQSGHMWVMIKAGNTYYIFDPEAEDEYGVRDHYFGKTTKERNVYTFNLNSSISSFHKFLDHPKIKTTLNITGAFNFTNTTNEYDDYDSRDKTFSAKVGDKINITTTINGTGSYITWHSVKYSYWDSKYLKNAVKDSKVSSTYTFDKAGTITLYIEMRDSLAGVDSLYYITVNVTDK